MKERSFNDIDSDILFQCLMILIQCILCCLMILVEYIVRKKDTMFNDIDTIYIMKERYQCLMILIEYILWKKDINV